MSQSRTEVRHRHCHILTDCNCYISVTCCCCPACPAGQRSRPCLAGTPGWLQAVVSVRLPTRSSPSIRSRSSTSSFSEPGSCAHAQGTGHTHQGHSSGLGAPDMSALFISPASRHQSCFLLIATTTGRLVDISKGPACLLKQYRSGSTGHSVAGCGARTSATAGPTGRGCRST